MKTARFGPVGASLSSAAPVAELPQSGGRRRAPRGDPGAASHRWSDVDKSEGFQQTAMQDISLPAPVRQRYFFFLLSEPYIHSK